MRGHDDLRVCLETFQIGVAVRTEPFIKIHGILARTVMEIDMVGAKTGEVLDSGGDMFVLNTANNGTVDLTVQNRIIGHGRRDRGIYAVFVEVDTGAEDPVYVVIVHLHTARTTETVGKVFVTRSAECREAGKIQSVVIDVCTVCTNDEGVAGGFFACENVFAFVACRTAFHQCGKIGSTAMFGIINAAYRVFFKKFFDAAGLLQTAGRSDNGLKDFFTKCHFAEIHKNTSNLKNVMRHIDVTFIIQEIGKITIDKS